MCLSIRRIRMNFESILNNIFEDFKLVRFIIDTMICVVIITLIF